MNKTLKILLSLIIVISLVCSIFLPINADIGGGNTGVLFLDTDNTKHQALKMTVDSVASTSSLQAFCVGWNFNFKSADGTMSTNVYVEISPDSLNFYGGTRTYTFPVTTGWTKDYTSITGGKSIRDCATYKYTLDQIMKGSFTVTANARVEKYSHSSGTFTPLGIVANTAEEIDSNFAEFTSTFKTNTKSDYYNLVLSLTAEPQYTNVVHIVYWDQATNTKMSINQSDITVTDYGSKTETFQLSSTIPSGYEVVGRVFKYSSAMPTSWADYNTWDKILYFPLAAPNTKGWVHILLNKPAPPPPNTGNIYIKCMDYSSNTVISSSTMLSVPYGSAKTITAPTVDGYSAAKGSHKTFNSSVPAASNMQTGVTSQTVTLTSTNKNAYVYFWYDKNTVPTYDCKVTVSLPDASTSVGDYITLYGSTNDTAGHTITNYYWNVPGADQKEYAGNSAKLLFNTKGIYDAQLIAQCSNGNTGMVNAKIYVHNPVPTADVKITGFTKENRKINLDGTTSYSPSSYPIDWTKAVWKIEPDLSTSAKWEMGVKLANGSVKTINQSTDQSFINGHSKLDFQVRYAGQYKVTLSIANTANFSNTVTKIITVIPDYSPVANFTMGSYIDRNQNNPVDATLQKWGKGNVYDNSYSPDRDAIKTRVWGYRYNSNNNLDTGGKSIYADEITEYKYTSNLLPPIEKMIYPYNWNDWDSEGVPLNAQRITGGYNNSQAIQTTANSTSVRCVLFFNTQSSSITGNTYTFSVYIKSQNLTGNVYINSYWTNQEGNWCWGNNIASAKLTGTNDWTRLIVTATAPANAYAQSLEVELTPGTGTVWISQPQIEAGSTASAYNANSVPDYFTEGHRLIVDGQNDTTIELWSYEVGDFAIELTVTEDIPDNETIKELLVHSDYRRGYKKEW